ncbi:MAG: peptidoglycan DD-metalloendopeptidase family protein, partial [Flavobacteriaceae bacterium]|nr:peptidoglycan DD-metalloendopeptidase family protein [Flavobacteriaceae bacterium]
MDYQQLFREINFPGPLRVLDKNLTAYIPVSLADDNKILKHFDTTSSKAWVAYISSYLKEENGEVAYGGYLEKRNLYKRSPHFNATAVRNMHLGMDLWCEAGTKVLAVLDGRVHSFQNNAVYGDYGPTVILKHAIDGIEFYSLYGHLSVESLDRLKPGQPVEQGAT